METEVKLYSHEAEVAVLGGLMLDNRAMDHVIEAVSESDFYDPAHRMIFRAIYDLIADGVIADVVTVAQLLTNRKQYEDTGELRYLSALTQQTPSAANAIRYARIVRTHAVKRGLASAGNQIADSGLSNSEKSATDLLNDAESKIIALRESYESGSNEGKLAHEALKECITEIDRKYSLPDDNGGITGLATGFSDLDQITAGLQPGDLVIVAGRPSMGKTTFAMNIAEHSAATLKVPTVVFSLEMPTNGLMLRMLASKGRIEFDHLKTGKLNDDDWGKLTYATGELCDAPLYIDDTGGLTPVEMRARARRAARALNGKIGLCVIDYLQLMNADRAKENRTQEVSEISRGLKQLAKELKCPIIALSQLSRSVESRPNKRPMMSDLRESGAIEQDADLIVFLYRDEYYNPDSEDKGLAEAIIAKHRNGETGTIRLVFQGQHCTFGNMQKY